MRADATKLHGLSGLKPSQTLYFQKKGSNVDDYINFIDKPGTPVDEIGLLIFARMYHLHMCIIMEDRCLTMQHEHDLDRCTVFIAYRGALHFNDTKPKCKEYS